MPTSYTLLNKQQYVASLVLFVTMRLYSSSGTGKIGVDYGLNGNNLMSPQQTVALLQSEGIARVRMYEARQEITQAFANSGIELMLGVPNELVPKIGQNFVEAVNWVTQNVASFPHESGITAIIVGNEWLLDPTHDPSILLPAMVNIYTALITSSVLNLDLSGIKVSTSHAYNVLGISFPPSSAVFAGGLLSVLNPLLDFLQQTDSFFMVNIFPYFAYVGDPNVSLDLALFAARDQPVQDPKTKLNYTNLFDLQLDAVYAALDADIAAGLNEIMDAEMINRAAVSRSSRAAQSYRRKRPRIVVGESGWPSGPGDSGTAPRVALNAASGGDDACSGRVCTAATVENARTYNQNLIRHVLQAKGTPANPTTPIEAHVFALFNENLKPRGTEQHYGLFFPNGTHVYPISFH